MTSRKDELLKIAAEVVAGERDGADLEAHGITLGTPIVGEEAEKVLLQDLEDQDRADEELAAHLQAAETLWSRMAAEGVQEGSRGRLEVLFVAKDRESAEALAAELGGDEDWTAKVSGPANDGQLRVAVVTRPLVLGREVVVELANQMAIHGGEFGCELVSILPSTTRRPWWRFR